MGLHVMSRVCAAVRCSFDDCNCRDAWCTASAAGLLAALGSAPYSVTKAACISWPDDRHHPRRQGIGVSVLYPQGVNGYGTAPAGRQPPTASSSPSTWPRWSGAIRQAGSNPASPESRHTSNASADPTGG